MKTRFYQIMAVSALCLAAAALAVSLWSSVRAQEGAPEAALAIPTTLNYQGYLREPDGSLTTGAYDITANIYNAATGGSPLYSTTLPGVTVRDGLFNIVLGDNPALPSSVFANAPLYIGITLNGGAELIPRQRLHAVPWAFQASTLVNNAAAQTIQGLTSNGNVTVNGATTMNGNTTINGSATISGDTTMNGSATVSEDLTVTGDTAMNGDASISGNVLITGTLAHPGETSVGPHFFDTPVVIHTFVAPCSTPGWTQYDASGNVPEGATAVIIAYSANANAGNGQGLKVRKETPLPGTWIAWGRANGDGDESGWGGQGIVPITDSRTFEYWWWGNFNQGCELNLIGYFK